MEREGGIAVSPVRKESLNYQISSSIVSPGNWLRYRPFLIQALGLFDVNDIRFLEEIQFQKEWQSREFYDGQNFWWRLSESGKYEIQYKFIRRRLF